MQTYNSDILTELRSHSAKMAPVLVLYLPSGGSYFQLRYSGRDRTLNSLSFSGRLVSIASVGQRTDWQTGALQQASIEVELANDKRGSDWENFISELAGVEASRIRAEARLYFPGLPQLAPDNYVIAFSGYVDQITEYNELSCRLSICDGLAHIRNLLGNTITNDLPKAGNGVKYESIGRFMPLIYGKIYNCPGICIQGAINALLSADIGPDDTTIPYTGELADGDQWRSDGAFMLGGELIYYPSAPVNGQFVGVTRGFYHTTRAAHYTGAKLRRWKIDVGTTVNHQYLIAGHAVKEIDNIKINDRTAPASDYEVKLNSYAYNVSPLGIVTFLRNPNYPNEEENSITKEVFFNSAQLIYGGSQNLQNLQETTEGDGIARSDYASLFPMTSGNPTTIRLGIAGRRWDRAAYSLGKIKSAKLIIRHKPFIPDADSTGNAVDKYILDPTLVTGSYRVKVGSVFEAWQDLKGPEATGDQVTLEEYPQSVRGSLGATIEPGDESENDGGEGWFSEEAAGRAGDYAWFRTGKEKTPATMGNAILDITFPSPKIFNLSPTSIFEISYQNHQADANPTEKIGESIRLFMPDASGTMTKRYIATPAQLDAEVKNTVYTRTVTGLTRGPYRTKGRVIIDQPTTPHQYPHDFHIYWIKRTSTYIPTNYGEEFEEVYDLDDVNDWSDLDGIQVEIKHNATGWIERQISDVHIEVEYWPYKPEEETQLTCDVKGRYDIPNTSLGNAGDDEYAEDIAYDLLATWGRATCPPVVPPESRYYYIADGSGFSPTRRYYATRIAKREDLITLLNSICYQSAKLLYFRNLSFRIRQRLLPSEYASPVWEIGDGEIIRGSFKVLPQPISSIYNRIKYSAMLDPGRQEWKASGTVEDATSQGNYGVREMEIALPLLSNHGDDLYLQNFLKNLLKDKRTLLSFSVRPEGLKLDLGDIIQVTYSPLSLSGVLAEVIGTEFIWPVYGEGTAPQVSVLAVSNL